MAISLEESRRFVLLFGGGGNVTPPPPLAAGILTRERNTQDPIETEDGQPLEIESND